MALSIFLIIAAVFLFESSGASNPEVNWREKLGELYVKYKDLKFWYSSLKTSPQIAFSKPIYKKEYGKFRDNFISLFISFYQPDYSKMANLIDLMKEYSTNRGFTSLFWMSFLIADLYSGKGDEFLEDMMERNFVGFFLSGFQSPLSARRGLEKYIGKYLSILRMDKSRNDCYSVFCHFYRYYLCFLEATTKATEEEKDVNTLIEKISLYFPEIHGVMLEKLKEKQDSSHEY